MTEHHPPTEQLDRFLRGELQPPHSKRLVRHLIAGCARCLAETRRLWAAARPLAQSPQSPQSPQPQQPQAPRTAQDTGGDAFHPARYEEAFRAALANSPAREAAVALERNAAPALAAELLRHPPDRRLTMVANSRRFRTVALCEHLLGTAAALWDEDPAGAAEVAELAQAVAEQVDAKLCGASLARSLQARALAYLGNARRLAGDLAAAEEAFARAQPLVDLGTGDPLERAEIGALRAALAVRQGRPALAAALYDRACHIYRALGETHLLGRTLLAKSAAAVGLHQMARLALLREGLALLDERQERRLAAESYHRLVAGLVEVDLAGEALLYLQKAQALFRNLDDPLALLRLRRLEGKIAEALGRPAEAERLLLEAWMGMVSAGLGYEAASVTVDLGRIYVREGPTGKSRRLAEQLTPIFRARDIDRRAVAGLLVLRRILETETASLGFLAELDRYLKWPALRRANQGLPAQDSFTTL